MQLLQLALSDELRVVMQKALGALLLPRSICDVVHDD